MKFRDLLILAGGAAAAAQASALSLGNTQGHVQLGAPVDMVFPVQADPGLTPESSCINAEVWMGDTVLSSSHVTLIPLNNSVRVRTTTPVSEPLVTVKLHAGCTGVTSRSYTFFADPPSSMAASVEPIDLTKIQVSTIPAAALSSAQVAAASKKPRPAKRSVTPQASATQPTATAAAIATTPAAVSAAMPEPPVQESTASKPDTTPPQASSDHSRLRVEPIEGLDLDTLSSHSPDSTGQALPTLSTIDSNTQLILDANAARLEAMEKQLQTLQAQLTSNRTEVTNLQSQLVQAQSQEQPMWVNIVIALLALAIAAIAWLLQRIKQERQRAQRNWADTVLAVDNSAQATTIDTQPKSAAQADMRPSESAHPLQVEPQQFAAETAPAVTHPSAPALPTWNSAETQTPTLMPDELYAEFEKLSTPSSPPSHDAQSIAEVLTAQALFDVQEQAEFYASIGENDQAIDILQAHIAQHASSSPLAYIELLQLLYRLSRTEAFEQVRHQFQAHFNVKVPEFLGFSRKGHDLWSAHPEVLSKIEALWPTDEVQPLLRSLIIQQPNEAHAAADARFDLSAFDDLLMLYNVAQTTEASSRGKLPGRMRTAPTEVPLPELVFDQATPAPAHFAHSALGATSVSLPLHEASLDLLDTIATAAPLAPEQPLGDSPFQGPTHFAPNEALIDGLSLDWEIAATSGTAASPAPAASTPDMTTPPSNEALDLLSAELAAFSMDERDLPPTTRR